MRILSGIQPTGQVHLGNYFGAIYNWVSLQNRGNECFYSIVDLHALTMPQNPSILRSNILDMAATLLAAGIDPDKSTLFVQSDVPQHTQLAWILQCLAPMGEMERMIQFKEKSEQNPDSVNAGLFAYPILQAADILLYRPDMVPVGIDQAQHLELTRTLARKFNHQFNNGAEFFKEPETLHTQTVKILGLDGHRKMSKSYNNYIALVEEEDVLMQKLRSAQTDPARVTRQDPGNPYICNIFTYHTLFSSQTDQEWAAQGCKTAGIGCMDCKKNLFSNLNSFIAPIREKYHALRNDEEKLRAILRDGAHRARMVAQQTIDQVFGLMGLNY